MCKKDLDDNFFIKKQNSIHIEYFKLCIECRNVSQIRNQKRKEKKSLQAKEHYEIYKKEIQINNKKWRDNNKDKLKIYEQLPERKEKNKRWRIDTLINDPCRFIFYSAKGRAKINNLPFEISKEDIKEIYPYDKKCPILGIDMFANIKHATDNSPTLDRIIPEKGYIKGNIAIISYRANRIKNDLTIEEIEKILNFLKNRSL